MAIATDTLGALAAGDRERAAQLARSAALAEPDSRLAAALDEYLAQPAADDVYDEPSAFESFIDHGGNPQLYRRTIDVVAATHARYRPRRVLDVGCGDGRVTAASRSPATEQVDLVEPSVELLGAAVAALERGPHPPALGAHAVDIATHLRGLEDGVGWDLAQTTFALHTTEPATRPWILEQLRERTPVLLVVEFDVPELEPGSPAHLQHLASRYELGVREYDSHPEVVTGFLMPVLVGQLDPARPRFTFEQPITHWEAQLRAAGWRTTTEPVADYWWADAVAILATPA